MFLTGLGLSVPAPWQQPKSTKNSSSMAVIQRRESARFPTQTQAAELAQRILSTQCTIRTGQYNNFFFFFYRGFILGLILRHMYSLPCSLFVSWLPMFWGYAFDILACGTYTTVPVTSHWEVTHFCSRLNLTELGMNVTATVCQGTAQDGPKVGLQSFSTQKWVQEAWKNTRKASSEVSCESSDHGSEIT